MKVLEIFRDEGLPEKKLSNEERVQLLKSKISALDHQKETIKQTVFKVITPMFKTGRVFTNHNKAVHDDTTTRNVSIPGLYIQCYEPIEGQYGFVCVKDIPDNQSLIKWLTTQSAKLKAIGYDHARRKGEGGKLSELHRRVRALERAQNRRPSRRRRFS